VRVALVHDYLYQSGGAERVIAALHRMFPSAPVFTTIADPAVVQSLLPNADVRTTWMQQLPGLRNHHRKYFMLYPAAIEGCDLREYDLVISNSSAYSKSVKTRPEAVHACYCHTPMRFAWDFASYAAREDWSRLTRAVLRPFIEHLRRWDHRTANRPTGYIANSNNIARRIERCYGLPSQVVHPPVEVQRFAPQAEQDDYHLVVSRLLGYKRIDLAVHAFNRMQKPLVIIGDGPVRESLQRIAGRTIRFLGRQDDATVAQYYARCRALIFPGEEDFGLTPLEANASGRPVVAFAAGGALDTVSANTTGVLFHEQTVESLCEAVKHCEAAEWNTAALRKHAEKFREECFRVRMRGAIDKLIHQHRGSSVRDFHHDRTVRHRNRERGERLPVDR
jgi:glycosyltransferase involved in cell wall biosynthesis